MTVLEPNSPIMAEIEKARQEGRLIKCPNDMEFDDFIKQFIEFEVMKSRIPTGGGPEDVLVCLGCGAKGKISNPDDESEAEYEIQLKEIGCTCPIEEEQ